MDKQVVSVLLSFSLYILFVLLPMVPSILIYKIFPETKVTASGVLSNLNFKTTGAFAAYVVTVFLGFFIVQKTQYQIAQISSPVWTIKSTVKLINDDGSDYLNTNILETLNVTIDPKLKTINEDKVILQLPGSRTNWELTHLKFEIPYYGHATVDLGEASKNADIDKYELIIKLNDPIEIKVNEAVKRPYTLSSTQTLEPNNAIGPKLKNQ